MELTKFMQITKAKRFEVFVYPKGHIKYNRGIDEVCTDIFEVKRNQDEKIIKSDKLELYKGYKVTEIIHNTSSIGVVVEGGPDA